tara:strand:+ start:3005 stop:3112 length:108 start_codon:yes stop_codon:yes gene_type:complete
MPWSMLNELTVIFISFNPDFILDWRVAVDYVKGEE